MQFEQVLADCIDGLDRGDTIEACLNRYPAEAQALLPLLALVVELQKQPKQRLSATAFTRIRAALAANTQRVAPPPTVAAAPPVAARPSNGHRTGGTRRAVPPGWSPPAARRHRHGSLSPSPVRTATRGNASGQRRPALRQLSLSLAILLFVGLVLFARQVMVSLPGAPLYGMKTAGEQVQGLLMTAAGEEAAWQARQATLRLGELAQLPAAATTQQATLAQRAAAHIEAALTASATLAPPARVELLAAWQTELQQLDATIQQNAPNAPAQASVQAALTAVALALTPAPTVLPTLVEVRTATATAIATTAAFSTTPTSAPTLPGITAQPPVGPSNTVTATATLTTTPTPVLIPTATAVELPSSTATATPLPVMTQVMPRETSTTRNDNEEQTEHAVAENTATPAPTASATVTLVGDDGEAGEITPTTDVTSTPPATDTTPVPAFTDEWLTPTATDELYELFTPTPWEPTSAPTDLSSTITPAPTATPPLFEQPTLIATEAAPPIGEPPGFATPPEPTPTQAVMPTATVATATPMEPPATSTSVHDPSDDSTQPRRRQTPGQPPTLTVTP